MFTEDMMTQICLVLLHTTHERNYLITYVILFREEKRNSRWLVNQYMNFRSFGAHIKNLYQLQKSRTSCDRPGPGGVSIKLLEINLNECLLHPSVAILIFFPILTDIWIKITSNFCLSWNLLAINRFNFKQ